MDYEFCKTEMISKSDGEKFVGIFLDDFENSSDHQAFRSETSQYWCFSLSSVQSKSMHQWKFLVSEYNLDV